MIRKVLLLATAGVVAIGVLRFADSVANADISIVRVEGELTDAERRQVRGAVSAALSQPQSSTAADIVDVVEALGWVRLVRVRRQWPDTLHVAVIRETLAARWGDDAWLTAGGNVVPAPTNHELLGPARLPAIRTHLSDGPQAMRVFNLINESAQALGLDITRLEENAAGHWVVSFADGPDVMLGATDLKHRFERFATVHRARLRQETRTAAHVDARYRFGIAVRWLQPPVDAAGFDARAFAGNSRATLPAAPATGVSDLHAGSVRAAERRFAGTAPQAGR